MDIYERTSEKLLSRLPDGLTHSFATKVMRLPFWSLVSPVYDERLCTSLGNLKLVNPVSASAGLDKNCRFPKNLLRIGFGGVTIGTVTTKPRAGNPPVNLVRLNSEHALLNSLGFPNDGMAKIVNRLVKLNHAKSQSVVSIADEEIAGVLQIYQSVAKYCSGIELNVSSPNTAGLKRFHDKVALDELLKELTKFKKSDGIPLFVKLPRLEKASDTLALAATSVSNQVEGVVLANSLPTESNSLAVRHGGMSGRPLYSQTLDLVKQAHSEFGNAVCLVASGGIESASQVWEMLASGALAVQIYTALVYKGPLLPRQINLELLKAIEKAGFSSVRQITGGVPWPL